MLSNTCKYAIRSVIYLAVNTNESEKIGIKKIAEDLNIPTPFLGKILQVLARKKILNSTKGPNGGFSINESTFDTSLMDIVEIVDGRDLFDICVIGLKSCALHEENEMPCPIHNQISDAKGQLNEFFTTKTIGALINDIDNLEEVIQL